MSLQEDNVYESEDSLNQYLDLHYSALIVDKTTPTGSSNSGEELPKILAHPSAPTPALHFPQRVAQLLIRLVQDNNDNKESSSKFQSVLDAGGSVGGTAFALASKFEHVDSFDYSANFVQVAQRLQRGDDDVSLSIRQEGDTMIHATIPAIPLNIRSNVTFHVGDACRMAETMPAIRDNTYDAIVLCNLLCRLPDPQACLERIARIINPNGGIVLLVTPFTWLEHYTERKHWIVGGENGDGCLAALTLRMEALGFTKVHDEDMPLLIREHARKYQYIISKATGWKKTS